MQITESNRDYDNISAAGSIAQCCLADDNDKLG
jgi:hypothetical protein